MQLIDRTGSLQVGRTRRGGASWIPFPSSRRRARLEKLMRPHDAKQAATGWIEGGVLGELPNGDDRLFLVLEDWAGARYRVATQPTHRSRPGVISPCSPAACRRRSDSLRPSEKCAPCPDLKPSPNP
jgi:hypothetical protein